MLLWWTIRALPPSPQHLSVKALNYNSLILYDTRIYVSIGPVLPPRFENVETIKLTKTQQLLQLHQWQNCNLDSFVVSPDLQLDHGIQQQGHCNY